MSINSHFWFTAFRDLPREVAPLQTRLPVAPNRKISKPCWMWSSRAQRVRGQHSDVLPCSLCSREPELQRLEQGIEVLKKDNNEESRMVLYTLTISKLWDGKKSGVGFNGNQCDAPDVSEHPWTHAMFVICNKETMYPRWVRAAVQIRSPRPGTGSAHTSSCSPEKKGKWHM